ncbi:Tbingi protein [Trypanosoma theileri]|uniref:Tbingi protein n=1 Tax=Trypanosoma theileri TaxID=67003 RepID=A0A1X0P335_9TRYP|nr:Tbingi protein [Trypanosoma theileri]ORC91271.1 Tbingi protein [Trypanosoma theileri]
MPRQASHKRWKTLCNNMAVADGCCWNILKRIYAPRPLSTPAIKLNNTVLTENQKAKHFIRLYSRRAQRHPHSYPPPPIPVTDTEFIPITAAEPERAQRLLPKGTAAVPDGIYGEALQHLGPRAKAETLALFNESLRTGVIPVSWKVGIVVPLLKPGKKATDLDSFRPFILTSCLSKLTEWIIAARIRDVIETKLTPQQSGFRPVHSTSDQLPHLRAALTRSTLDSRTGAVFVDYAKAFDTVDHDRIVSAMREMDIPPHIIRWSASFLKGRQAKVRVNSKSSPLMLFHRGVPQGTVLGPLMFIIVMNTLSKRLSQVPLLFHGFSPMISH